MHTFYTEARFAKHPQSIAYRTEVLASDMMPQCVSFMFDPRLPLHGDLVVVPSCLHRHKRSLILSRKTQRPRGYHKLKLKNPARLSSILPHPHPAYLCMHFPSSVSVFRPFTAYPRCDRVDTTDSWSDRSTPHTLTSFGFSSPPSSSSQSSPSSQHSFRAYSISPRGHPLPIYPRIQVSSLLSDPYTRSYQLDVIQHPQRTAEFGSAGLSRLPLTPPIIVQLTVRDPSGAVVIPEAELPFLVAHLSLHSESGRPLDLGSSPGGGEAPQRLLYGNLVSMAQKLEDLQGNMGLFFLFSDVSIRWRGRFELGITLLRISRTDPSGTTSIADRGTVLAQTRTRPFNVLPHEEYSASPPTRLTQSFMRQGASMLNSTGR